MKLPDVHLLHRRARRFARWTGSIAYRTIVVPLLDREETEHALDLAATPPRRTLSLGPSPAWCLPLVWPGAFTMLSPSDVHTFAADADEAPRALYGDLIHA